MVLLEQAYNELRRAVTFLHPEDLQLQAAFAPFVTLGRKSSSTAEKQIPQPPQPPQPPAPPAV